MKQPWDTPFWVFVPILCAAALLLIFGSGCGKDSQTSPPKQAPAAEPQKPLTLPPLPPSAERGKKVYESYCQACHGPEGRGNGPGAASLPQKPANFGDKNFMSKRSDEDLYQKVSNGVPPFMPAWQSILTEQERRDVVEYIRTFTK